MFKSLSTARSYTWLSVYLVATATIAACATQTPVVIQPNEFQATKPIDHIVEGGSIETDFFDVELRGQFVTRTAAGALVPVQHVTVTKATDANPEPRPFTLSVDQAGQFDEVVSVMVCRWPNDGEPSLHQYAHWPTLTITAPGCEPLVTRFDESWVPHQVVLTCRTTN
jgi:hypothetical protein